MPIKGATSINIQGAKMGAEQHDRRTKRLDYVRNDLTHNNRSWEAADFVSVAESVRQCRERYFAKVGQRMQGKATPIREGVVVINADTTLDQLRDFAAKVEQTWGIRTLAIYTHQDEGHIDDDGRWQANRHAHLVFDWTDHASAKSLKLNRRDMSKMQTILADSLQMARGESSDLDHLSAIQQKNASEAKRLRSLRTANEQATSNLQEIAKVAGIYSRKADDEEQRYQRAKSTADELTQSNRAASIAARLMPPDIIAILSKGIAAIVEHAKGWGSLVSVAHHNDIAQSLQLLTNLSIKDPCQWMHDAAYDELDTSAEVDKADEAINLTWKLTSERGRGMGR